MSSIDGYPRVSALISVQHEDVVMECLRALVGQRNLSAGECEAIVIDGFCHPPLQRDVQALAAQAAETLTIRFLSPGRCGRAAALNAGMRVARGKIFLFLADDFVADRNLISSHLLYHARHPEIEDAAVGPGLFPADLRTDRFTRWLEDSGAVFGVNFTDPDLQLPFSFFYAGNTSVKRELMARAGEFAEHFPFDAWDDYEMGLRLVDAGYTARYLPDAVCWHRHHVRLRERMQQVRNAGCSAAIFDERHGREQDRRERIAQIARSNRPGRLAAAISAWFRAVLLRKPEPLAAYYRLRLDGAFVDGYRQYLSRHNSHTPTVEP